MDLLAVQGTLKSLFQHHRSKASIIQCSSFFTVQLSHPYMTTGKTIALTKRTFVGKVISLLFNMLLRLVITFLPRSKHSVLKICTFLRQWHPTPVLLPGKSHGRRSLVGCSPWDSQEPSPTPQFKSINSSALSFLHSPTLTSIHDYWKNHSID